MTVCVVRSRRCDHSCRGNNFFLVFWSSGFLVFCFFSGFFRIFIISAQVGIPCGLLAISGGLNALSGTRRNEDILTAGLLLTVGAVAFARSVKFVDSLCAKQPVDQSLLLRWHILIGLVFSIAIPLQFISLRAFLSQATAA